MKSQKLHVVLADDDETFLMLFREALAKDDEASRMCEVHTVTDGREVLEYVSGAGAFGDRERFPLPHLFILDHRMRTMDGPEVLMKIKSDEKTSQIPVCILSTSTQQTLRTDCYRRGATFYVEKPLGFDRLKKKVGLMIRFFGDGLDLPA